MKLLSTFWVCSQFLPLLLSGNLDFNFLCLLRTVSWTCCSFLKLLLTYAVILLSICLFSLFLSFFPHCLTQFYALGSFSGDFDGMRGTHIVHSLFKVEIPRWDLVSMCCIQKSQQNVHCCLPSFHWKLDLHS